MFRTCTDTIHGYPRFTSHEFGLPFLTTLFFIFFYFFLFFLFENYSDRLGKVSENPGFSQHSIPDPCLPYKHMVGGGLWGTGGGGAGVTSLGRRVEGQGTLKLMNGIGIEFKFGSFVFKLKKMFSDEKLLQDYTEVYFEEEVRLLCINIAQACKIQRNTWVWNSLRDSNNFFCSLSFMSLSLKKKAKYEWKLSSVNMKSRHTFWSSKLPRPLITQHLHMQ